jgi:uncharacterized cupredoxin-like copper-binding protein
MEPSGSDRQVWTLVAVVLSVVAMVVASIAVVVALSNNSSDQSASVRTVPANASAGNNLSSSMDVTLEEYQMITNLDTVKAGRVKFTIHNVGTMTHEMVLVRADSVAALPLVTVAGGERAVGDVNEDAIPESDLPGEATAKKGQTVTKTITLTPGSYVMICNIDDKQPDGTVLSHFQRGMHATFTVG